MGPAALFTLRAVGLAVGLFALTNLVGELLRPPFDTTSFWIGGAGLPSPVLRAFEIAASVSLVVFGLRPIPPGMVRLAAAGAVLSGALLAGFDVFLFYRALARGAIHGPSILPASLVVLLVLLALAAAMAKERGERLPWTRRRAAACVLVTLFTLATMPLLLMFTFGPTRYERKADCAIVFGARVWDDGTPSQALADRVDEAIRLYQKGFVSAIIMSGAIDRHNGFSEPEVMRARAVAAGIPKEAVLLDEAGIDTASTVRNSAELMRRSGFSAALCVTHYYHEPRSKMLFERAGVVTYTVPAKMSRRLLKEPYFIAREILAYWHSFFLE